MTADPVVRPTVTCLHGGTDTHLFTSELPPDLTVEHASDVTEIDDSDCVLVVPHDGWVAAVRQLRSATPSRPVLVTGDADPEVGALASRLGVEYAPTEIFADGDETLADRVLAAIDGGDTGETDGSNPELRGQEALAALERDPWFEAVFDHPSAFVALLDTDGTLLRVNRLGRETAPGPADDLVGRPFWELPWWSYDQRVSENIRSYVGRAADGETVSFETDYSADGHRRTADGVAQPVTDGDETVGVVVSGHDVTELRRTETALRDLHDASTDAGDSFEEQVATLLEVGCAYLGLDIGFLAFVDEADDRFEVVHARGDHPLIQADAVAPLSTTYCRKVLGSDDILTVTDAAAEGWGGDPAYERYELGCYVGGQLTIDGESVGSICFADEAARDYEFSSVEESFVELLVERANYELERERRSGELQTARDQLETVIERIDDGFFAVDTDWEFTYLNEPGHELLKQAAETDLEPDQLVGENIWDRFPEAGGTAFETNCREAMERQEPVSFEEHYEPLDVWLEMTVYPSEEGLSVFFKDVTDRKNRERALNDLLSTTRTLMAVDDRERIAEIVCRATMDIIGLPYNGVRLYDPDADELVQVALTEYGETKIGDLPSYPPGEGLSGTAFERGETVESDDLGRGIPDGYGPIASAIAIPLGRHGVLSLGTESAEGISDPKRTLATILAANATAALDRAERVEQLQLYRAVHESVQEHVFVLDDSGRIRLVTEPLAAAVGVDAEAIEATPVDEFLPPEGVERGTELLRELRDGPPGASRAYETTLRSRDGSERPVEVELSLFPDTQFDGAVGVVRDRTELETERARFSSLFERSPDAIVDAVVTDDGPIVRDVNPAFEETFGIDREEAIGRCTNELIVPKDDREHAEALDSRVLGDLSTPVEVTRLTDAGTGTFLFRGVHYGETERGPRAFGIYTDISDRKADERRIKMLDRVLRHNLRNNGTVAQGYLELLADTVDDDTDEFVERALDAVGRIMDLSGKVHDLERIFEHSEWVSESASVPAVVDDAVAAARAQNPDATFEVAVDEVSVRGGELVSKAVAELVENAAVHAGDAPTVRVSATAEEETVRLAVYDDGPGIPDRERTVITGDTDITQLNHSRGLGLWLAWYVADAVEGSLTFDQSVDGGAVVLELPRCL